MIIEDVVDTGIDLEGLVDLVGGTQIEDRVALLFRRLVGLVADEILAGDIERVAADLERLRDRIIDAGLDPVARNGGNLVARQDLDIAMASANGLLEPTSCAVRKRASTNA
jgi:hypothetical protein